MFPASLLEEVGRLLSVNLGRGCASRQLLKGAKLLDEEDPRIGWTGMAALKQNFEGNPEEQPCQSKEQSNRPNSFAQAYILLQIAYL